MSENQVKYSTTKEWKQNKTDFKVVSIHLTDPADSLYAVVTPVKNNN